MNRYTKEYNKLKDELRSLEDEYNKVKSNYDNEYNLYNEYCDSIKEIKIQRDSLTKKYSRRWDLLYRGLSFSTFLISSVILVMLNVKFFPAIIMSLVPTGAVLGGIIIFSDKIKKLPIFSSLIDEMKELSSKKQEIFKKNEETKQVVSTLCKELEDIKTKISSKEEKISNFENALYKYMTADASNEEVIPEKKSTLVRKRTLL